MADPVKTEETKENVAVERGTQYPADNLETAIGMLEKVRDAVGFNPAQREMIAQAVGYKSMSGHAARRLGTLSHFDLLERTGKGAAKISLLGKSILMPTSEGERREAIAEAARRPNLYAALIAKYAGHGLPTLLPNLLVREHGVHASVAEGAAASFRETVDFAGLLRNGVLFATIEEEGVADRDESGAPSTPPAAATTPVGSPGAHVDLSTQSGATGFTIPLDGAGRKATITMPLPISKRDLRKVGAWITYMNAVIEDDEEKTSDISAN